MEASYIGKIDYLSSTLSIEFNLLLQTKMKKIRTKNAKSHVAHLTDTSLHDKRLAINRSSSVMDMHRTLHTRSVHSLPFTWVKLIIIKKLLHDCMHTAQAHT